MTTPYRWRRIDPDIFECAECHTTAFWHPGGWSFRMYHRFSDRAPLGLFGPFARLRDAKAAVVAEYELQCWEQQADLAEDAWWEKWLAAEEEGDTDCA